MNVRQRSASGDHILAFLLFIPYSYMGFLVTLAAGGHVRAFESIEDLCSQLPKIFNINEEDVCKM